MSDSINKNYSANEAAHQRRAGIRRIADQPVENSLINSFFSLQLHQVRPTGQAMLLAQANEDKLSPRPSATLPHYCTTPGNDGATPPATPRNPGSAEVGNFGGFSSQNRGKSIPQMIKEMTDQLANGWIEPDCNGVTRDPYPQNDSEIRSQLFKELKSRNQSNMKKDSARIKQLVKFIQPEELAMLRDENGKTALEIAIDKRDSLSIWRLVKGGAGPSIDNPDCLQAIHVAVMKKDWDLTRLLIRRGADINVAWGGGITPLGLALKDGYDDIAELLVNSGADMNMKSQELTPLIWAIRNCSHATAQLLVQRGARIDACGEGSRNALMEAVFRGPSKGDRSVAMLLRPLHAAIKTASPPPYDINQQTVEGHTALSLAYLVHGRLRKRADMAEKDMQEIIFMLQGNGARSDFLLNRFEPGYGTVFSKECVERAVRDGLGKEGDPNAKIAFINAVESFYHPKDRSYLSLLRNIPVSTRYEEKQGMIDERGYCNQ